MTDKEELQGCIYSRMKGDVDECFFTGKDCKPSTECILLLCKQLQELEKDNFSLLQEGRSFLTTMQELEELTRVQEETIKIQTKDKIYLRAKIAEWKDRAKELDDACCKITAKNINLTKLLTKMYNEYREDGRISKDVIYSVQSIFGE